MALLTPEEIAARFEAWQTNAPAAAPAHVVPPDGALPTARVRNRLDKYGPRVPHILCAIFSSISCFYQDSEWAVAWGPSVDIAAEPYGDRRLCRCPPRSSHQAASQAAAL